MSLKLAYFIKLFLITVLSTVFFASVGAAPEQPILFLIVSAACAVLIRFIWHAVLKDEKAIARRKIQRSSPKASLPADWKRAA